MIPNKKKLDNKILLIFTLGGAPSPPPPAPPPPPPPEPEVEERSESDIDAQRRATRRSNRKAGSSFLGESTSGSKTLLGE